MRPMKAILILATLAPTTVAWGERTGWDQIKQKTNSIEGRIKSIMVADNRITVKVETSPSTFKIVDVCTHDLGSDFKNFEQTENMALMRDAYRQGQIVQISFNGPFDRCLDTIQYSQRHKPAPEKPAAEKTPEST